MDLFSWWLALSELALCKLRLGKNGAHHVVKVMRDATRKRNEGFKLLLGERLLLNSFEVRDIGSRADITRKSTTGRKMWNPVVQHRAVLSICPTKAVLHLKF